MTNEKPRWKEQFKKDFKTVIFYGDDREQQAIDYFIKFIRQTIKEERERATEEVIEEIKKNIPMICFIDCIRVNKLFEILKNILAK